MPENGDARRAGEGWEVYLDGQWVPFGELVAQAEDDPISQTLSLNINLVTESLIYQTEDGVWYDYKTGLPTADVPATDVPDDTQSVEGAGLTDIVEFTDPTTGLTTTLGTDTVTGQRIAIQTGQSPRVISEGGDNQPDIYTAPNGEQFLVSAGGGLTRLDTQEEVDPELARINAERDLVAAQQAAEPTLNKVLERRLKQALAKGIDSYVLVRNALSRPSPFEMMKLALEYGTDPAALQDIFEFIAGQGIPGLANPAQAASQAAQQAGLADPFAQNFQAIAGQNQQVLSAREQQAALRAQFAPETVSEDPPVPIDFAESRGEQPSIEQQQRLSAIEEQFGGEGRFQPVPSFISLEEALNNPILAQADEAAGRAAGIGSPVVRVYIDGKERILTRDEAIKEVTTARKAGKRVDFERPEDVERFFVPQVFDINDPNAPTADGPLPPTNRTQQEKDKQRFAASPPPFAVSQATYDRLKSPKTQIEAGQAKFVDPEGEVHIVNIDPTAGGTSIEDFLKLRPGYKLASERPPAAPIPEQPTQQDFATLVRNAMGIRRVKQPFGRAHAVRR